MKVADTSLVVAAFASWHEKHEPARSALDQGLALVDHCALETFSVLTRLPERQIAGGAAYDALVAATAAAHRAVIVTCDRRAMLVYERYEIRAEVL